MRWCMTKVEKLQAYFVVHNDFDSIVIEVTRSNSNYHAKIKCHCGNTYIRRVDKLRKQLRQHEKIMCKKCKFIEVASFFNSIGLKPMFEFDDYNFVTDKLLCEREGGYLGFISYHKARQGDRLPICSRNNPYSIRNINLFIERNDLKNKCVSTEYKDSYTKLNFLCVCGNIYQTSWHVFSHMKNDRCRKCSNRQSKYSELVEYFLIENNLTYEKEYGFSDCRDVNKLLFDFVVFKNNYMILIEVDGEQHEIAVEHWGGKKALKKLQKRDKIKNEYCFKNNIELIRISYKDIKDGSYKKKLDKLIYGEICELA